MGDTETGPLSLSSDGFFYEHDEIEKENACRQGHDDHVRDPQTPIGRISDAVNKIRDPKNAGQHGQKTETGDDRQYKDHADPVAHPISFSEFRQFGAGFLIHEYHLFENNIAPFVSFVQSCAAFLFRER